MAGFKPRNSTNGKKSLSVNKSWRFIKPVVIGDNILTEVLQGFRAIKSTKKQNNY
jgi:hypothetical protein